MSESVKTRIGEIQAPYGRNIRLDNLAHESGMEMLRLTIREGFRYTILEIDAETAKAWGDAMNAWAEGQRPAPEASEPPPLDEQAGA